MNLKEVERKAVSLSWLIISTRDYKAENDWYWDKKHHCCYGVPKKSKIDSYVRSGRLIKIDEKKEYMIVYKYIDRLTSRKGTLRSL